MRSVLCFMAYANIATRTTTTTTSTNLASLIHYSQAPTDGWRKVWWRSRSQHALSFFALIFIFILISSFFIIMIRIKFRVRWGEVKWSELALSALQQTSGNTNQVSSCCTARPFLYLLLLLVVPENQRLAVSQYSYLLVSSLIKMPPLNERREEV